MGSVLASTKDMGLVAQVFNEANLAPLTGHLAIGHTRYSTTGSSNIRNAQPYLIETMYGPLAVAHNGNLTNALSCAGCCWRAAWDCPRRPTAS